MEPWSSSFASSSPNCFFVSPFPSVLDRRSTRHGRPDAVQHRPMLSTSHQSVCTSMQKDSVDQKINASNRRQFFQSPNGRTSIRLYEGVGSSSTTQFLASSSAMGSILPNASSALTHHDVWQSVGQSDESQSQLDRKDMQNYAHLASVNGTEQYAPLVKVLTACGTLNAASFHFPGHSRGAAAPSSLTLTLGRAPFLFDLPELPDLDNLHAPHGVIAEAQRRAAVVFGADVTWFLVNGSTCGIHAAVMATCRPGDYVILPRNCHISAVSAMVLAGALPRYVKPLHDRKCGISHGVSGDEIDKAITEVRSLGGRIGAVLIVSPTYFGVCSSVRDISTVCHDHNLPLIVDEAHGGHFIFHPELPEAALEQGADIAVQSTHKVLCSFTQSAMLHLKGERVCRDRISHSLRSLQTSSPSYLLLASLDAATAEMSSRGHALIHRSLECARLARNSLRYISRLDVLDNTTIDVGTDMKPDQRILDSLRITVGFRKLGITGFLADKFLCTEFNVVAELPALHSLTFVFTPGVVKDDVDRMIDGLKALAAHYAVDPSRLLSRIPTFTSEIDVISNVWEKNIPVVSPRDAFFAPVEKICTSEAIGRICQESICLYPPGIPIIAPGEIVTKEAVDLLRKALQAGAIVSGCADPSLSFVLVCKLETIS